MMSSIELEVKFRVARDQAEAWLKKLESAGGSESSIQLNFVRSTYYDTPDLLIHRQHKSSLRHRMVSGKQDITIKSEFIPSGAVIVRNEITHRLGEAEPFDQQLQDFVTTHLGPELMGACEPIFSMDIVRHKIIVAHKSAQIEVVYDRGDIHAIGRDQGREHVSEIEFELVDGSAADFFDFIAEQIGGQEWVQLSVSKAQRGYALVDRSERLRPRKHAAISTTGLSSEQLFMSNMQAALQHFLDNNPAYLKNKPGAIHQTRVAIRRLRAIIRLYKDHLSFFERKALNGELRWFQAKLGTSRDWYVLYSETLSKMDFLTDKERDHIANIAKRRHDRELEKGLKIYGSARVQRLIVNIQGWLARHPLSQTSSLDRLRFKAFKRNTDRLQALGDVVSRFQEDLQDVHAIRIIGKKFRYALEIFPAPEDQTLAADLAQVQEYLGIVNDIDRALALIFTHGDIKLSARTRTRMHQWAGKMAADYVYQAAPYLDSIMRRQDNYTDHIGLETL